MPNLNPASIVKQGCFDADVANAVNSTFTQPVLNAPVPTALTLSTSAVTQMYTYQVPLSPLPGVGSVLNGVGKGLRIHSSGIFNMGASTTLVFTLKLGTVTVAVVTCATIATTGTNLEWNLNAWLTVVSTGTAGTVMCHAMADAGVTSITTALSHYGDANTAVSSAINLVTSPLLEIDVNVGTGNASTVVTPQIGLVEFLN